MMKDKIKTKEEAFKTLKLLEENVTKMINSNNYKEICWANQFAKQYLKMIHHFCKINSHGGGI